MHRRRSRPGEVRVGPARAGRGAWWAGVLVALGAAAATAHGLYSVVAAAGVPSVVAGLYPLITDGLAFVAYAAAARLTGAQRTYAWVIVIIAAGLSGLAQAAYLAAEHTGPAAAGGAATAVAWQLRAGVGAWPAIAAAFVAHLLHLLPTTSTSPNRDAPTDRPEPSTVTSPAAPPRPAVQLLPPVQRPTVQPRPGVHTEPVQAGAVQPVRPRRVQPSPVQTRAVQPARVAEPGGPVVVQLGGAAVDRAALSARSYLEQHGSWPTTSELAAAAGVSRGTAGNALKALRTTNPADQAPAEDPAAEQDPSTHQ